MLCDLKTADESQRPVDMATATEFSSLTTAQELEFAYDNMSGDKLDSLKPKRLHVSNIPFRYRDSDLRKLFSVN